MRNWLHLCGFKIIEAKKSIYFDGHERPDVVKDRVERFIPEYLNYLENAVGVAKDDDGNMVLTNPDAKFLFVNQDEKVHHSNEIEKL